MFYRSVSLKRIHVLSLMLGVCKVYSKAKNMWADKISHFPASEAGNHGEYRTRIRPMALVPLISS